VAGARAYADYLTDDFGPRSGGIVVQGSTEVFRTADALAQSIVDEVTSGAYGDPSPPPAPGSAFPWLLVAKVAVAGGVLAWLFTKQMQPQTKRRRRVPA
jgi:hypothetical protein